MKLRPTVLPALGVVLTLAACGSLGTKTVVVTRTTTAASLAPSIETYPYTGSIPAQTTPTSGGTGTITTSTGTLGTIKTSTLNQAQALNAITAKAKAIVHLTTFRSPTGNIGCVMLDGTARCDINQRYWKPPSRPASCSHEVDFGQGLEVGSSGKAGFVCAGDTAIDPTGHELRYGDASVEGNFACQSATTGMTCTNLKDGHGFSISRERYRVF